MSEEINQEYRGYTINVRVEEPLVIHTMTDLAVGYVIMTDGKINIDKFKRLIDMFLEVEKTKVLAQIPEQYSNVNLYAFSEWMAYKKYKSKGAITKTLNMLNKYDHQTQQEIVDKSIMNEYKGLFEPKQQPQSFKQQDSQKTEDALDAFLIARENGFDLRNVNSETVQDVEVIER